MKHHVLALALALAALTVTVDGLAQAQSATPEGKATLPEVDVVTSKPPKEKPKPKASPQAQKPPSPAPAAPPAPQPTAPPSTAAAPAASLSATEVLAAPGATITDALSSHTGVDGTTFAPGANRPILRGLDNNRIRIQENGLSAGDVSDISEDHAFPVDPCAADKVAVIRGPAALRYGNTAVGGIVSVENGRIPTAAPNRGASAEISGGLSSIDSGRERCAKASASAGNIVVHADTFARKAGDYGTPLGTQTNSAVDTSGFSFGASYVNQNGYAGFAFTRFESLYAIPGEEAAAARSRIDMGQDKWTGRTDWKIGAFGIDRIRGSIGYSDYAHNELDFDPATASDAIGSFFANRQLEGTIELQHMPVATIAGRVTGMLGATGSKRDLEGLSNEGDNLLEPNTTEKIAGYVYEDLEATEQLHILGAVRVESSTIDGATLADITNPASPIVPMTRDAETVSASLGTTYDLGGGVVARSTALYSERAPEANELFSKGAHDATGTFELGNPAMTNEIAQSLEAGLAKTAGRFRFDMSAYVTAYDGFIFKDLTGATCDGTVASCAPGPGRELKQIIFGQRDANFYGAELSGEYDVGGLWNGLWGLSGRYEFVDAKFTNGEYVPRIPPHKIGAGLYYRDPAWQMSLTALHAFAQDEVAPDETTTASYTLLNAEISYTVRLATAAGTTTTIIGLKSTNLLDDEIRNATSFKKDDVVEPGASVKLFGTVKLN